VIHVSNRPWFDNIHKAKQDERQGPAKWCSGRYQERDVHTDDLVPDDAAVIVNPYTPGAFAAYPDARERDCQRHAQLNMKSEIHGQPEQQDSR